MNGFKPINAAVLLIGVVVGSLLLGCDDVFSARSTIAQHRDKLLAESLELYLRHQSPASGLGRAETPTTSSSSSSTVNCAAPHHHQFGEFVSHLFLVVSTFLTFLHICYGVWSGGIHTVSSISGFLASYIWIYYVYVKEERRIVLWVKCMECACLIRIWYTTPAERIRLWIVGFCVPVITVVMMEDYRSGVLGEILLGWLAVTIHLGQYVESVAKTIKMLTQENVEIDLGNTHFWLNFVTTTTWFIYGCLAVDVFIKYAYGGGYVVLLLQFFTALVIDYKRTIFVH